MAFVTVGNISDVRLTGVYSSSSASTALSVGKVVALLFNTNTLWNPKAGTGVGCGVDYAVGSASYVVGVLWGGTDLTVGFKKWGQCVTRGPVAKVFASGTIVAYAAVGAGIATTLHGYIDDVAYSASYPHNEVGVAVGSIATAVTDSIAVYVNTTFC